MIEFYDGFYAINFPDIIFADKVILYEGDTERMLIKNVLLSDRFETLRNQYISFVQVGGAYAIKYKPILEYLNVKSLIITDLDYKTEAKTEADVRQSSSTNATINTFAAEALSDAAPTVETLYSWKDSSGCIVSNSSNNPCVAMYRFFEMWGQIQISAKTLNQFYYNFAAEVDNIQQSIGIKGSVLKKGTYIANEEMIKAKLHTVFDRFKDDPYFQFIYGADYESYFSKPGVTKARDCLKGNTAYSILSAYKLFYVGCSRARRNLTILLDSSKIKGNLEPQKKRFEEIGFQVVSSPIH